MDQVLFVKVFAALFAIMSPIANLPVFLALTADLDAKAQRKVAATVIVALCVGAVLVAFGGAALLDVFGIGVDDFRLAGGFLILLIAMTMISGEKSQTHHGTDEEQAHHQQQANPAVYPLTVPILLGPGTISTLIIFRQQVADGADQIAYGAAIASAIALLGITFLAAPTLSRILGQTAISIMSRLMGMILAAIAMDMMVSALKVLLPGLAG